MTNENSNPVVVVSFEGVKMKEFRAYWAAVARGDWAGQDKFFARVVKSWPYELDPSLSESYGELALEQYLMVQNAIKMTSGEITSQLTQILKGIRSKR